MKKVIIIACSLFLSLQVFAQRDGINREGEVQVEDLFNDLIEPGTTQGIFRGVSFDLSKAAVKTIETNKTTTSVYSEDVETELIITTDMGDNILDFADITYTFDDQGLYHIKVETYGTDLKVSNKVYDMVVAYYTKKLGAGVMAEDGYLEFKGKFKTYTYVVALSKIDYEDSPGMYMYIYIE